MKIRSTGLSLLKNHLVVSLLLFNFLHVSIIGAQTFTVNGTLSVSTTTVRNASITFIDVNDTTKKFYAATDSAGNYQVDIVSSLGSTDINLPTRFELAQNYPNPFATSTSIPYTLNQNSDVQVTIYDILGRQVKKYTMHDKSVGTHDIVWRGKDDFGQQLATGIYFYQFHVAGENQIKKMILVSGAGNDSGSIPSSAFTSLLKYEVKQKTLINSGTYDIRIENTPETFPLIIPETKSNQEISGTSKLDISVACYYPIANSDVDLSDTKQIIRGFGAANIMPWRPDMTPDEIQKAFGTGDGQIGFSILRLRVPVELNEFNLNISTAKAAYDMGVTIMASPWSPPAEMKTNNNTVGGRLKEEFYDDFAAYLNAYAVHMAQNGVPLHSISVQNEPDIEVTYESCDYSPAEMLKFMQENAPDVGVPVCTPESFQFRKNMSDPILNDSSATAHTAYISGHIYGGGLEPYPLAVEKGKELWMTEHLVLDTDWNAVLSTGNEINDCMNAGMSAYIWWYIVRFYGPIIDDDDRRPPGTQKGEVSKRGFVMSQFARFIRPGYYRVQCNTFPQRNVFLSSYKKDNSRVTIVAINRNSGPVYQTFSITNKAFNKVTPYTTTELMNCRRGSDIAVNNNSFTVLLEPSSITSFVSN